MSCLMAVIIFFHAVGAFFVLHPFFGVISNLQCRCTIYNVTIAPVWHVVPLMNALPTEVLGSPTPIPMIFGRNRVYCPGSKARLYSMIYASAHRWNSTPTFATQKASVTAPNFAWSHDGHLALSHLIGVDTNITGQRKGAKKEVSYSSWSEIKPLEPKWCKLHHVTEVGNLPFPLKAPMGLSHPSGTGKRIVIQNKS